MPLNIKKIRDAVLLNRIYSKTYYKGKHIIIIGGRIYATKTGLTASKMLKNLLKNILKKLQQSLIFQKQIPLSLTVYLFEKIRMKLGNIEYNIPVGFMERDDIPPLLGRIKCLDKLKVVFYNFTTSFSKNSVY